MGAIIPFILNLGSKIMPFLGTFFNGVLDKTVDAGAAIAPILVANSFKFARISIWVFGVTFILNLSLSLLAFTFYHIGMTVVISLANYCHAFTVTMILNALLGVCVLFVVRMSMPLIQS